MKKIYALVLIVCLLLSSLLGGCQESRKTIKTTADGVRVYLEEDILSPEAECVNVIYENPTDQNFTYGEHFSVQMEMANGDWEEAPFMENMAFLDIGLRLEDHDLVRQSFLFGYMQGSLSEGKYRIHIDAFDVDLEFEIREGGAKPEKQRSWMDPEIVDMSDPPKLEKSWQWYRMWDFARYMDDQDKRILKFVPGENGLVAFVYGPKTDDLDLDNIKACLCVIDRKSGKMYEIFEEPSVLRDNVEVHSDGFRCTCDDGTYEIRIINGKLAVKKQ